MKAHRTCDWVWRAVKHWGTRDGGNIVCVWTPNPSTKTPPTLSLWQCALEKREKKNGDGETDTLCCETLIATAAVCLQLKREQCRSCESVCGGVCVWEHIYECICSRMCMHVLSPFALVFYKCGGGGGVLSRHSVWIYYQQTRCCFGTGRLYIWWASRFYLRSTDALSKACVGRAAFEKETVNWPGYGLLQLNLKH